MGVEELSKRLLYYKRRDVQKAIVDSCKDREVGIKYGDKGFGKRPDILVYENDVLESVKKGTTSFHVSEERWSNPMHLSTNMKRTELDELRIGWDLVLDIDCPHWFFSKITTHLFVKALKMHGISSVSCKFSGNKGFHIGVPFETFPLTVNNISIKKLFPEGPKRIALYLLQYISKNLIEVKENGEIIFDNKYKTTVKKISKLKEYKNEEKFDTLSIVDLDTLLISSRHMFRAPYSMHEKSGLVSLPIDSDKIIDFEKDFADPKKVKIEYTFLDTSNSKKNEALELLVNAFDYGKEDLQYKKVYQEDMKKQKTIRRNYDELTEAIPKELFPPCINNILSGLEDGRKRSLFILTNFFTSVGWSYDQIQDELLEWNKKNQEQLKEALITGQIRYHKQKKQTILPPNCRSYYKDFGVCSPDNLCEKIKNPVQYSKRKVFYLTKTKKPQRKKLTEEQKEMRRKYRETLKNKK